MQKFSIAAIVAALLAGAAVSQAQDVPEFPKPQKQHEWLQQLAGQWESDVVMFVQPAEPPVKSKGTETVRAIGGFWILAENQGEVMGQPFTGLLTLGYDAEKKQYVGTWVDSMTGYLWKYAGDVDESEKVLTLETEGPCPAAPGTLSKFKEVLQIKSKDHTVFTSSMQGEDGEWTTLMKIDYHRKK